MQLARPLIVVASGGLLAASVIGLVARDDPAPSTPAGPGEVAVADFKYGPEALEIAAGSTVTWSNQDDAVHTVDSKEGAELDSGSIDGGATFEHTFEVAGTYAYYCKLHPFMKGTVEVTG